MIPASTAEITAMPAVPLRMPTAQTRTSRPPSPKPSRIVCKIIPVSSHSAFRQTNQAMPFTAPRVTAAYILSSLSSKLEAVIRRCKKSCPFHKRARQTSPSACTLPPHRSSRRMSRQVFNTRKTSPISGLLVRESVKAVQRQTRCRNVPSCIRRALPHPPCRKVTFFRCSRFAFSCACPIISAE